MSVLSDVKGILLDIEGTITPVDFVHDVLFSYARARVRDFVAANFDSEEVRADIALLCQEHGVDLSENRNPPPLDGEPVVQSIAAYVEWLIGRDSKATGLKSLQGKIWRQGYLEGTLKSQVFADVAPALERWRAKGLSISIFSSGSVLAQQLLVAHTEAGDLTRFIDHYFDTAVGKKREAGSYRRIAEDLRLPVAEIIFISDIVAELDAADEAGMKPLLVLRPGNSPQLGVERYAKIHSFDDL